MLALTPQHRLLLAVDAVDFRRGIDGLAAICIQRLKEQPDSGTVFVFTNKRRVAVKILVYDGHGFWICMKRFSQGKLQWWPTSDENIQAISAQELNVLSTMQLGPKPSVARPKRAAKGMIAIQADKKIRVCFSGWRCSNKAAIAIAGRSQFNVGFIVFNFGS